MSWRYRLEKAFFRNIEFLVETAETEIGRRNKVHEYPFRDVPYAQPLGRRKRDYSFNAYFLGDDYMDRRDRLMKAIEEDDTPGTLLHPTLGAVRVVPGDCKIKWSNKEGGIEYLELTFEQAGELLQPDPSDLARVIAQRRARELARRLVDAFGNSYKSKGLSDFIRRNAANLIGEGVKQIVKGFNAGPKNDGASDYQDRINEYQSRIDTDVTEPETLGNNTSGLISDLSTVYDSPRDAYKAQKIITDFSAIEPVGLSNNTPERQQDRLNRRLILSLFKDTSLSQLCLLATDIEFVSREEALKFRDELDTLLDDAILRAGDDDQTYQALVELRAAILADINERAINLPTIQTIKITDSLPALVVAYDIYENANKDADIIERNSIRHPGFIPPGSNLEFLR